MERDASTLKLENYRDSLDIGICQGLDKVGTEENLWL
jgi:hypothetical protein